MTNSNEPDGQAGLRSTLRVGGAICLGLGIVLFIVGLVDFFHAFSGEGTPKHFWIFFIAMPLSAIGLVGLRAGYFGAVTNWAARESAPALGTIRRAWDSSVPGGATEGFCTHCGAARQSGNRFCGACGGALAQDDTVTP